MSEFNFKSQICTTREQSERLLALGLKKETADMIYERSMEYSFDYDPPRSLGEGEEEFIKVEYDDIPAWSLHRLLMMTTSKSKVILIRCESDLFDVIIQRIERDIKVGYFSKDYLV